MWFNFCAATIVAWNKDIYKWSWEKTISINFSSESLWGQIYLRTVKQSYFLIKGVILQPRNFRFGLYRIHGKVLFWSTNAKKHFHILFKELVQLEFAQLFAFQTDIWFVQFSSQFQFKKERKKNEWMNEAVFLLYALSTSSFFQLNEQFCKLFIDDEKHLAFCQCSCSLSDIVPTVNMVE